MSSTTIMDTQKPASTLDTIASIRTQISDLASRPDVLAMICAGGFHPDLRLGDAIQALDELSAAMQEYESMQHLSVIAGNTQTTLPL
ncbi:MAG: hypothetical protein AAF063_00805 [Cyanobacteria bacterium J06643_5]